MGKTKPTIILIHGLYMNRWLLKPLEKKFKMNGFNVCQFEYKSVHFSKECTLEKLNKLVESINSENIILIGHSMGGLIARLYYSEYESPKVKKIITLATPHNGSVVAKYLMQTKFKKILGTCGDSGIIAKIQDWEGKCPLGCIAGISDIGINNIMSKFHGHKELSDGNVFLNEALLSNATDRLIVKKSHAGIVLSEEVFNQCIAFIINNKFKKVVVESEIENYI
jgi:hypothetical protein